MFARPAEPRPRPAAIANWLTVVAILVFLMIVVGGITRLTESGLSMVRWEPISGAIPPLDEADWQAEFDHYRASPQYQPGQQRHDARRLQGHLLLGICPPPARPADRARLRLPPALLLVAARDSARLWLEAGRAARLGRAAGRDRLVDGRLGPGRRARGQPYPARRPPAHRLPDPRRPDLGRARSSGARPRFGRAAGADHQARPLGAVPALPAIPVRRLCRRARGRLCLQHLAENGRGMVSGRSAGLYDVFLRNFVDNPIVVQFVHRWLAFVVAGIALWLALAAWAKGHRGDAALLAGAILAQILLGILTILSGVQIDIAVAHQGMAALLLAAMVSVAHDSGRARHDRTSSASTRPSPTRRKRGASPAPVVEERSPPAPTSSALPFHLSLAGRGRGSRRGRRDLQDTRDRADALIARIAELHSYDVPAAVSGRSPTPFRSYGSWVDREPVEVI